MSCGLASKALGLCMWKQLPTNAFLKSFGDRDAYTDFSRVIEVHWGDWLQVISVSFCKAKILRLGELPLCCGFPAHRAEKEFTLHLTAFIWQGRDKQEWGQPEERQQNWNKRPPVVEGCKKKKKKLVHKGSQHEGNLQAFIKVSGPASAQKSSSQV